MKDKTQPKKSTKFEQPFVERSGKQTEHEGMPSLDSPLSPIRPRQRQSSKEDLNEYEDNFDQDKEGDHT